MIKGYYVNAKGDVLGVKEGKTVSINEFDLGDGYENFDLEGEDFSDSWCDDSFEDFDWSEDDFDFPWDEDGADIDDYFEELFEDEI